MEGDTLGVLLRDDALDGARRGRVWGRVRRDGGCVDPRVVAPRVLLDGDQLGGRQVPRGVYGAVHLDGGVDRVRGAPVHGGERLLLGCLGGVAGVGRAAVD